MRSATDELSDLELTELRMLLYLAFDGGFDSHDWDHSLGGRHFLGLRDGAIVAHAAVVARELRIDERTVAAGIRGGCGGGRGVPARGIRPPVMSQLGEFLASRYELGALSAAEHIQGFYGRLGWERWRGPTAVIVDGALADARG